MDTQHLLSTWIAETAVARRPRVFNHNLHLAPAQFRGFELVNTVVMAAPPGSSEMVYLFTRRPARGAGPRGAEDEVLRVALGTHADRHAALLALGQQLEGCMNPQIGRAEGALAKQADIAYAAGTPRGEGGASFTVGNVAVAVSSVGHKALDVAGPAAQLAQWLGHAPTAKARRAERITTFAPSGVKLEAGETLTLIEHLSEPDPGAARLQVLAADGELRREGDALVFVAGKAGRHDVALFSHTPPGL